MRGLFRILWVEHNNERSLWRNHNKIRVWDFIAFAASRVDLVRHKRHGTIEFTNRFDNHNKRLFPAADPSRESSFTAASNVIAASVSQPHPTKVVGLRREISAGNPKGELAGASEPIALQLFALPRGMTTANKITIVRILMIPAFVTMAIYYGQSVQRGAPLEWQRYTAIVIFLVAAASDGLDGYVARRYNQRSALGVILDPIADKGLLLSGIITLSISNWSEVDPNYGKFPLWFPVLVITRDVVILVGSAILHLLNGKVRVKTSWTGKVATVLQMAAIAWVMLQLKFPPLFYVVVAAGVFTFISGLIYVMDGVRQLQAEGHANAKVD